MSAIGFYTSTFEVYVEEVNLRLDWAVRGKQRTLGWKAHGE
jgi:hypothetical protein